MTTLTIDPFKVAVNIAVVLMMVGVLPFTPVTVGALIMGSMTSLSMTFRRR